MSYRGVIVPVPYGSAGLETDVSQILEPPMTLLLANNVSLRYGSVEKEPGSTRWNTTPLPSGIAAFSDWWPDDINQQTIAACKNGKLYSLKDQFNQSEVKAGGTATAKLNFSSQTHLVAGGSEQGGNPRKLFVFTGNDPVQVISGNSLVRTTMSKPALDWGTGNWPTFGIVFNGSLWAMGSRNNPHVVYRSNLSDHEDFQTIGAAKFIAVFPGEFQGIIGAFAYKTRLYILKYPFGLYYIDDTGTDLGCFKIGDSFGGASSHAAVQALDDMLVANSTGSVTSLQAVFSLGQTEQGDLLKMLKNVKYMQETTSQGGTTDRHAIYYEDKKQAIYTYRSSSGFMNDRLLKIDYHANSPKVTWSDKDQPNCLGLIKDYKFVPRPFYGAEDGYLYDMDNVMKNVGGNAYTATWQTPYIDFSWVDKSYQEKDKIFDFIGVSFESAGNWNLSCDAFVDNQFVKTLQFNMSRGVNLDRNFQLDKARLNGPNPTSRIQPLDAMGRRISLRFYQAGLNQGFKVPSVVYYFRPAGQNNR